MTEKSKIRHDFQTRKNYDGSKNISIKIFGKIFPKKIFRKYLCEVCVREIRSLSEFISHHSFSHHSQSSFNHKVILYHFISDNTHRQIHDKKGDEI
jgi:hypothetical protein